MSDFKIIAPAVLGSQDIASNSTTQNHDLGFCVQAEDDASTAYGVGEFIYAKGLAATVVGSVVTISEDDFSTALAVANGVGKTAFAMSACVAGEYGWYQTSGKAVAKSLASNADNVAQYLTATAGSLDDAVVAGDRIHRAISGSAVDTPSSGLIEMEIDRPSTDNIAD
tara:strand:- start:4087 stop:4590 length:504 start_codon:yes stop_codon:yes gene_type:complete